jgi:hypothetical protein
MQSTASEWKAHAPIEKTINVWQQILIRPIGVKQTHLMNRARPLWQMAFPACRPGVRSRKSHIGLYIARARHGVRQHARQATLIWSAPLQKHGRQCRCRTL